MRSRPDYPCGTLIMAGIEGTALNAETVNLIRDYGVGNFIIFKRNVSEGPESLKRLCEDLKDTCEHVGLPSPIIGVDQEGGGVQRLGPPLWDSLPSASATGTATNPKKAVTELAGRTGTMLNDAGINMNLAPVLDIAGPAAKGVLKGRCFGSDPNAVAQAGVWYIRTIQGLSIAAVAKHFPGIGMVRVDPHRQRPVVDANADTVAAQLTPFRLAINAGVSAAMTSHVIFPALDSKYPATCSRTIAHDLLRKEMGFQGVLITDDMEMGGITEYGTVEEAAVMAFLAGHDLLLVCHRPDRIRATVNKIQAICKQDGIAKKRLEASLERMDQLREKFCSQGNPA